MSTGTKVVLFPPDATNVGVYLLGLEEFTPESARWARWDGSFTEPGYFLESIEGAIGFETAEEAIEWAEAAPRSWQVTNGWMFKRDKPSMPRRMTVRVIEARFNHYPHESVEQRRLAGEQVTEIAVKLQALDVQTPFGGCNVLIDKQAMAQLNAAGIHNPGELVGHVLMLEADDPADVLRPLRIVGVRGG